jgi:hypothetical protein
MTETGSATTSVAMDSGRSSIRARIRLSIVLVSTATMAAFTSAAIFEERRRLLETEAVHAATLLEHLAHMPEFQKDAPEAQARLASLHGSLAGVGGRLELGPPDEGESVAWTVLARRELSLRDARLELRYRADPARLSRVTRAAVLIHSVHGFVALAALLVAVEWILRRNLLAPLRSLTHQIGLIRDGRGWTVKPLETDQELRELSDALRGMGPGLEQQVHEWMEAERRSAVALALMRTGRRLQETRKRVLDLLAELEGAWVVAAPDRERRIRSLVREVDRIPAVIESETQHAFALLPPAAAERPQPDPLKAERRSEV